MKLFGSLLNVLSFVLANGLLAHAQTGPTVSADDQATASLGARAIRILQGRPAIEIMGIIDVHGVTSKLTRESVQDTVELVLRRNGIPVVPSCESGANCGRLIAMLRATCTDLFPPDPADGLNGLCAAYIKVEYQEWVHATRPKAVPADLVGGIWFDDFVGLVPNPNPFEKDKARKPLAETVEKFALYYLRANPAK